MNANDNFENKELPLKDKELNNANLTPVSESETEETKAQSNETTQQSEVEQNISHTAEKEADKKPEDSIAPIIAKNSTSVEKSEMKVTDLEEETLKENTEENKDKESSEETITSSDDKDSIDTITPEDKKETEETKTAKIEETRTPTEESEEVVADATKKEETDEDPEKPSLKEDDEEGKSTDKKDKTTVIRKKRTAPIPLTFEQIVNNLRELSKKNKFKRKDLDRAQYLFLNECRKEIEAQKALFVKEGGKEEDFVVKESDLHNEGKELLKTLAEKRKQIAAEEEKLKEINLKRKLEIIERVKELTKSQDDFNKVYQEFKSLQQEWKDIRIVPHGREHELWKSFQLEAEKFYDLVRIHNEFRDYDFKKNLEVKIGLCKSAEKLVDEDDIVSAFHQLQKLHRDWRDIGPVARKDREVTWQRFRESSTLINKKYQAHIETLKEKENENYEKKVAICEKLEAIDLSALKTTRDWDSKTREVLNLQNEWRQIGYAPRKVNAKIFRRYRAACDLFFKQRNAYYHSIKGELEENLKKKIELCERVEEMKDSTDWRETTPKMIAIQREWKEIGMVPRRNSSSVWKRFITACDYFFEQKKLHSKALREEEVENLKLKNEITEKIKEIDTSLSKDEALSTLKELTAEWQAIGFVPFRDKDRAFKEFMDASDFHYDRLNIDKSERKLETFKTNISEMTKPGQSRGKVFHERDKLMRQFERMKAELQTYENNIGFLTSSSKKGSALVDDMNSKIEKIKAELELIVKKIDAIDEEI